MAKWQPGSRLLSGQWFLWAKVDKDKYSRKSLSLDVTLHLTLGRGFPRCCSDTLVHGHAFLINLGKCSYKDGHMGGKLWNLK